MQGRKWTVAWDPIKFSEGIINFYDWRWRQKAQDAYVKLQQEQEQSKKPLTQLTLGQQPMTRLKQEQGCWVDDVQRMGEPASPRVLVIMWLPRAVLSLSLCLSHKEKSLYFGHGSVTPSLRQAHICSGLGSTGGHRSSPGPGPAPRRTPNNPAPRPVPATAARTSESGRRCRATLRSCSCTQQPGCATRDDVNTVERERAVPEEPARSAVCVNDTTTVGNSTACHCTLLILQWGGYYGYFHFSKETEVPTFTEADI